MERERVYWREHRDYPHVFVSELAGAVQLLTLMPATGSIYSESPVPGVRRLYLSKLTCHVYYTFDENEVIIRALWGARRERGPTLK